MTYFDRRLGKRRVQRSVRQVSETRRTAAISRRALKKRQSVARKRYKASVRHK